MKKGFYTAAVAIAAIMILSAVSFYTLSVTQTESTHLSQDAAILKGEWVKSARLIDYEIAQMIYNNPAGCDCAGAVNVAGLQTALNTAKINCAVGAGLDYVCSGNTATATVPIKCYFSGMEYEKTVDYEKQVLTGAGCEVLDVQSNSVQSNGTIWD